MTMINKHKIKITTDYKALEGKTIKTVARFGCSCNLSIRFEDDTVVLLEQEYDGEGGYSLVFGTTLTEEEMFELGFITQDEYQQLNDEEIRISKEFYEARDLAEFKRLRMKFEQPKHIYGAESLTSRKERGNTNES